MSVLLIPIGSIVCLNKLSNFAGFAKSVVGLEPRPCDTEAFDRNTAPIWIGHVQHPGKSDIKVASNRHMAFRVIKRIAPEILVVPDLLGLLFK